MARARWSALQTFIPLLLLAFSQAQTTRSLPTQTVSVQVPESTAQASPADDASKEAIIFEKNLTRVIYQADGTGTRETTVAVRMQSEAGVKAFAVLAFAYTSYNDQVEVDYVRVRKPDGTVVATPDYNIQDMPADVTRQAPMYSDIHEKHVTVKALGVGDVLEYLVRYRTIKPEVPGHFWFEYTFTKTYIIKDEEVEITFPRDKYVKVASADLQPIIKEDATHKIFSWKTSNLDLKEREALMKKSEAPKPSVQITTFHSWEEVGNWYKALQQSQVVVTPQIQAKVAELTKGLTSDDAKIRAIYKFVSTQIHYVSLSFGIGRYQPHSAEDVFENEYGDCKDKHTLLATMLQAAGMEAWPALMHATQKLDPDVPSPGQFNHLISVVPRGKEFLWLDTTPEVAPAGLLLANLRDKQALVMPSTGPPALMTTPAQPPFPAVLTFTGEGKINSEGTLNMHVQRTARGDLEVLYRAGFRSVSPAQWKQLGQQISNFSGFGGEVSEVTASAPDDTDKPFQFAYDYTRKTYSEWSNHRIIAPLPLFGIEASGSQEEKPVEPIILGAVGEVVFQSKITLPAGLAPQYSDKKDLTEDFADYHATYGIENGVLKVTRRLVIKKSKVPIASWDSYKKFCKAVSEDFDRYVNLDTGMTEYPPGEGPAPEVTAVTNQPFRAARRSQEIVDEAGLANPEAKKLMDEGAAAMRERDLTHAQEVFRKVIAMDPKFPAAHNALAVVYLERGDTEGALREFRKEEEYHPENPAPYYISGRLLSFRMHRDDEALAEYQKLLKIDPANRDAALAVAAGLNKQHKYSETVQVLEKAVELAPDSSALRLQLAKAYLHNDQRDKALPMLKQGTESADASANILNSVVYELADTNVALDVAAVYGDKALRQAEADSVAASNDDEGLADTLSLGEIWDTVGWVSFRQGDFVKSLPYIRAAWLLTQDPIVGNHLGQLYEKLGRKSDAAHQYELALAASFEPNGENRDDLKARYKKLTGKNPEELSWNRRAGKSEFFSASDELNHLRTVRLSPAPHGKASADFIVIFSPGKIPEVKFETGKDSVKVLGEQISRAKLQTELPNANPSRVFRRGILSCGEAGCNFVFLLPDRVHVQSPAFVPN